MIKLLVLLLALLPRTSVSQITVLDYLKFDAVTVVLLGDGGVMNFTNLRLWDYKPTDRLRQMWREVEVCVGVKRDFDSVTWLLADLSWNELGALNYGVFLHPPSEIVLVKVSEEVIKHEMAHAISMEVGNDKLARRCSDAS